MGLSKKNKLRVVKSAIAHSAYDIHSAMWYLKGVEYDDMLSGAEKDKARELYDHLIMAWECIPDSLRVENRWCEENPDGYMKHVEIVGLVDLWDNPKI